MSKSELDKKRQIYKKELNIESKTKMTIFLQLVKKEIYWNKKKGNQLRGIYSKRFILSAKRQKLVIKKLEKKTFKIYNIKAL